MVKWKQIKLGDCFDKIVGGGTPSRNIAGYWHGNIPWATVKDFNTFDSRHTQEYITADGLANSATHLIPKGTPITSTRMGLGRIVVYDIDVAINQDLKALFIKKGISSPFIVNWFIHNAKHIEELGTGSTVKGIRIEQLTELPISFPPIPEQRAIATALSDVDGYIAALERLIAKKRDIKKGAMQELLTGKRRLPEFSGKWVEITLGEFCPNLRKGQIITESARSEGNIPVVAGGKTAAYYHNAYNRSENTITISASGASAGFVAFWDCKIFASDCSTIEASNEYDVKFVYYYLLNKQSNIYAMQTGGAQPHVQPPDLALMIMNVPAKAEQSAIAEILSDMDAEIDALTAKLAKVRNIKQGMMQELLTGRIRLVNEETQAKTEVKPSAKVIELPKRNSRPAAQSGRHNQQFDDAVMIAGIVNALYSDKYLLGRKKVQKCLYLLRRHQDESTAAFKKKAAGPYADEVRYKGGEPIARKAKYIITTTTKKGTTFAKGSDINQALNYIESWGKQDDIQWLIANLKFKKVDELELLATVDMAICDLEEADTPVSVASIKHLIATNKEWKAKLEKQTFSDTNIAYAIKELQTLL